MDKRLIVRLIKFIRFVKARICQKSKFKYVDVVVVADDEEVEDGEADPTSLALRVEAGGDDAVGAAHFQCRIQLRKTKFQFQFESFEI